MHFENKNYKLLFFILILNTLFSCSPERTLKKVASDPFYLEKKGKYCNLYFKNVHSKYILISDSVRTITTKDSIGAYSRIEFRTYPDMIIAKIQNDGTIFKKHIEGLEFEKVFPTYFNFPISTGTSSASEMYNFSGGEVSVKEKDIVIQ